MGSLERWPQPQSVVVALVIGAAVPKRREGVAAQVVNGEAVLLSIESGEYFSLNRVGSRIWELCDGTKSAADIVSVICAEFDVAQDAAAADIHELLRELAKEKLVEA